MNHYQAIKVFADKVNNVEVLIDRSYMKLPSMAMIFLTLNTINALQDFLNSSRVERVYILTLNADSEGPSISGQDQLFLLNCLVKAINPSIL
jgi:hypothetical protein